MAPYPPDAPPAPIPADPTMAGVAAEPVLPLPPHAILAGAGAAAQTPARPVARASDTSSNGWQYGPEPELGQSRSQSHRAMQEPASPASARLPPVTTGTVE